MADIHAEDFLGWLHRAIQIKRIEALDREDKQVIFLRLDELIIVAYHRPRLPPAPLSEQVCNCCGDPWPCKEILVLARDYRGQVAWRPHWDELLKELAA